MISGSAWNPSAEVARQQALSSDIAQLQTDISTGIKVHVASDDPAAHARIAQIGISQSDNSTYAANVVSAQAVASLVDTSLTGINTSLTRAKELMINATTGTLNANDRAAIVAELQGIAQDLQTAGTATDANGQPLYAQGTATAIPIGRSTNVAAGESYDAVFGSVTLSDGSTSDIATIMQNAINAVNSGDTTQMNSSLDSVGAALSHVTDAQADAGVRSARINSAADRLADDKTNYADERQGFESTDATEAIATLSQKMTTLSAAQSVLAKIGQTSLFDKLS